MGIPSGQRVTTSNFKNKGFLCGACGQWKPVVSRVGNIQTCNDCLPEGQTPLVEIVED